MAHTMNAKLTYVIACATQLEACDKNSWRI